MPGFGVQLPKGWQGWGGAVSSESSGFCFSSCQGLWGRASPGPKVLVLTLWGIVSPRGFILSLWGIPKLQRHHPDPVEYP